MISQDRKLPRTGGRLTSFDCSLKNNRSINIFNLKIFYMNLHLLGQEPMISTLPGGD